MAERQWQAARGASIAVFGVALSVLAVAVPKWARHVADYDSSGPHDTAMFGDPAGWALVFVEITVGPIVFVAVGVFGAYVAGGAGHGARFAGRCARRQVWMQALAICPTAIGLAVLALIPFAVLAIPLASVWMGMVAGSTAWLARSSVERSMATSAAPT